MCKQLFILFFCFTLSGCRIKTPELPAIEDSSFSYDDAMSQQRKLQEKLKSIREN